MWCLRQFFLFSLVHFSLSCYLCFCLGVLFFCVVFCFLFSKRCLFAIAGTRKPFHWHEMQMEYLHFLCLFSLIQLLETTTQMEMHKYTREMRRKNHWNYFTPVHFLNILLNHSNYEGFVEQWLSNWLHHKWCKILLWSCEFAMRVYLFSWYIEINRMRKHDQFTVVFFSITDENKKWIKWLKFNQQSLYYMALREPRKSTQFNKNNFFIIYY